MAEKIDWMVDQLSSEFEGQFDRDQIRQVLSDSATRLAASATVPGYIPLLAHRFARERLKAVSRLRGNDAQSVADVVFVSLSGGGRGQLAAALTTVLSNHQVSVHSAGTAVFAEIDPGVASVLAELGVKPDDAFARPVTDEVVQGADVIVTMGHSVGAIQIPPTVRHEDWRIGDPIGAPIDEIRRVRADIEYRVRALLDSLGVGVADEASAKDTEAQTPVSNAPE